ncbi:two-component sensor histidine kinase [Marivirga lumbricoides]|uniref:histidine kinase n=1 Tax=Marivirga lumbricoides TaxID=1046115 RepID=A0ABQ1MTH5_9BACT|nr:two-component sensor histidine kinase [Marivirga lumbricoides]
MLYTIPQISFGQLSYDSLIAIYENQLAKQVDSVEGQMPYKSLVSRFLEEIYRDNEISDGEMADVLVLAAKGEKMKKLDEAAYLLQSTIPWVYEKSVYVAFLHYKLGEYFLNQRKLVLAIEQYLKAAMLFENEDMVKQLAKTYLRISMVNLMGSNEKVGINYSSQGLELMKTVKLINRQDSEIVRSLYSVKGLLQRRMGDYESSLNSTNKAIEFSLAMKDSVITDISYGNKAVNYYNLGKYDEALPLLKRDYDTSLKAEIYYSAFNAGIYMCKIYLKKSNKEALQTKFNEITKIFEEHGISNNNSRIEYYKIGADLALLNNDVQAANEYLIKFMRLDEIRDSVNKGNDIAHLQEKYMLDREINKLELLEKSNQLQATHLKLRTALLIIIALALIIVLWYVFVLRQKNNKIDKLNELLEAKVSERTNSLLAINKELDTYLYRASHDIRRPIRTLLGLNNVSKLNQDKKELEKLFDQVHFTALSMDKMLFKLQMAYDLNNDHPIELVNLKELLNKCLKDMAIEVESFNAKIKIDIAEKAALVRANNALMRIVLENILENAMLYQNHGNPEIEISTDIGKYFFYIHIKDNGYGIPSEYFDKIFTAYFKISNKTQGSGLGLFLAHRAISFLDGEIVIQSQINMGSHFTIKIPVSPK